MTVPHSGMLERPWKDQHTEISRKINAQKFQELTKVGALVRIYRANVKQELKEQRVSGAQSWVLFFKKYNNIGKLTTRDF